jgi:hypothetical protein
LTNYQDPDTTTNNVLVTLGSGEAGIESTDLQSLARERLQTARMRLADTTDPAAEVELALEEGASISVEAPPDVPATDVGDTDATLSNPLGGILAAVDDSGIDDAKAAVASELPTASGAMDMDDAIIGVVPDRAELHLVSDQLVAVSEPRATTSTVTNPLGSGVDATVDIEIERIEILPTDFIDSSADPFDSNAVIVIEDLTASVDCHAEDAAGTAAASWSATLGYWSDSDNDGQTDGSWQVVPLSGTALTDPLDGIANTVVYEAPGPDAFDDPNDVYLFPIANHFGHPHAGYLDQNTGWSSAAAADLDATPGPDGRTATAGVDRALQIRTTNVQAATTASAVNVSVVSLSCSAEDQR